MQSPTSSSQQVSDDAISGWLDFHSQRLLLACIRKQQFTSLALEGQSGSGCCSNHVIVYCGNFCTTIRSPKSLHLIEACVGYHLVLHHKTIFFAHDLSLWNLQSGRERKEAAPKQLIRGVLFHFATCNKFQQAQLKKINDAEWNATRRVCGGWLLLLSYLARHATLKSP